jgi:glutamate-1-semialdehyde 2,1-aminomutase
MRDYTKSMALSERASQWTPFGSQTLSKAACRFPWGAFPPVLVRGEGCHVWDADGNEFIDLICSLGATAIGYGNSHVMNAVARQMAKGTLFSLPSPLEGQVAERFCKLLGWPTAAKFAKTGSDACSMAVRAARAYTDRDVVLVADNGYHGTHDWFTVLREQHPGVPNDLLRLIDTFEFNDLASLDDALGADVALVMLEPTLFTPPTTGFLEGVVAMAHEHCALVCFDETILGGRMAVGGGGEFWGVVPDLAVFGKALGGGYPIACVVGAMDVIERAVGYSGTFFGDCIGLAAMDATLDVYRDEPIIDNQWNVGTGIMLALNAGITANKLEAVADGYAIHPRLTFTGLKANYQMSVWLQEMAERGVLAHPAGFNVPGVMTPDDVASVLMAISDSLAAVADGVPLRGDEIQGVQIRGARKEAA